MSAGKEAAKPLVSVLIYVKNAAGTIAQAVESVLSQGYPNMEVVVIDGASTDGTAEYLAEQADRFAAFVSEPDSGGAEAANKALSRARGDIVCFVLGDDWLVPGALSRVAAAARAAPEAGIVSTGVRLVRQSPDADAAVQDFTGGTVAYGPDSVLATPMSAAKFYRRDVFERLGGLDPAYPYAHDREFLMRCWLAGVKGAVVDEVCYVYRQHPGSRTLGGNREVVKSFLEEHWRMSAGWLVQPGLSRDLVRGIQRWRRHQRSEQILLAVRDGKLPEAARLLFTGTFAEPALPFALAAVCAERLCGRLRCVQDRAGESG